MTFEHAIGRLALASVACGGATSVIIAALATMTGGFTYILGFILIWPAATIYYALGLAVFGVPLLWLWPRAFLRTRWRGLAAAAIGSCPSALLFEFVTGWGPFWGRDGTALVLLVSCGALAGYLWWWLNFDAAPD